MLPRLLRPLVLAGSALTLGVTALALPAAHAATPASYVALGDSYSSGTGTRTYLGDGTSCQRSVYAYPSLISSARGYALNFRACSGAKVADVRSTQLSALTASTAYVTISVGGNDAGFTDVLTQCALPSWASNCNGAIDGAQTDHQHHDPGRARLALRLDPRGRAEARRWSSSAIPGSSTGRTATCSPGSRRARRPGSTRPPTCSTASSAPPRALPGSASPTRRAGSSGTPCATRPSG